MRKLALFTALLCVVFAASALAGAAIDPDRRDDAPDAHGETAGHDETLAHGGAAMGDGASAPAADAYALELHKRPGALDLRVVDADGDTQRDFDVAHEKRLHLIVVRRDLTGFQHLHPEQLSDGSWSTPLSLPQPGSYRVVADFELDGSKHTPSADLQVDGAVRSVPLPAPATHASVDGFDVELTRDGEELSFAVSRDGAPVALEDYLGAKGHLVALRASDLEYAHVHPDTDALRFAAELPSAGRYRLFLQFQVDGAVRTAEFTVDA